MNSNFKSFKSEMKQGWFGRTRRYATAAGLALGFISSFASPDPKNPDLTATIQKAISNYQVRKLKAREYAYGEADLILLKGIEGKVERSEQYEVIPLGESFFRRHIGHDGRPLPPEEQLMEKQRLEKAMQEMEENAQERVNTLISGLRKDSPQKVVLTEVTFIDQPDIWQLDLAALSENFTFRFLQEETTSDHKQLVVEVKPAKKSKWQQRGTLPLQNFTIKLWIDQEELEIVRLEARAQKEGIFAQADLAVLNSNEIRGHTAKATLNSLYESALLYDRGTIITQEWNKMDEGVWLSTSVHVMGKQIYARVAPDGNYRKGEWPMEERITYFGYRKFRVNHRILPDFTVVKPGK